MGLPGDILAVPGSVSWPRLAAEWGDQCDCGKPAEIMMQGETDSFGYEVNPFCGACAEKARDSDTSGTCDWCKKYVASTAPIRDYDEGSHGPVYYVCGPCRTRYTEQQEKEWERA